ncbi:DUF4190 domain-containing protein [Streptomyces sp. NPDC049555]|uniref:DUF4190 domain-containing protein n=1 Tax=unclassified Streptomyces TaxID=2593676 RepID=UPI003430FCD2
MSNYQNNPYAGQPPYPPQQPQQPPAGYGYPGPAGPGTPPAYPAAPPVQPYPMPGYGGGMPPQPSNGMGTAGLVLGIIGVVFSLTFVFWFLGVILGILAIIFGAVGRHKATKGEATNKGAATAGLVCGIVATVLLPLLGVLFAASLFGLS